MQGPNEDCWARQRVPRLPREAAVAQVETNCGKPDTGGERTRSLRSNKTVEGFESKL